METERKREDMAARERKNIAGERRTAIEVNDLKYTYPGKRAEVLKGLNFKINRGEIFGFLGPSGAGKSTTQKVITGILKGYQGEVRVAGKEIAGIDNSFYERIGVSFEFPNLYERFTALEN